MSISYRKDNENIVTLTVDQPGRPVNVINAAFGESLAAALAKLQKESRLTGVIIRSAKSSTVWPRFNVNGEAMSASFLLGSFV